MFVRFVAATLLVGALVSPSAAQLAIQAVPATPYSPVAAEAKVAAEVAPAATAAPAATPTPSAEAPKPDDAAAKELKQKRLQKIQQLQFDRRPSTILKTWLEPAPKPPVKEADKPTVAAPVEAAPAAAPVAEPAAVAETPATDAPVAEGTPVEPTPEEKAAA
jgi:hypothetical protein